jgi:capsular exopolysaccharide synthesis family protein
MSLVEAIQVLFVRQRWTFIVVFVAVFAGVAIVTVTLPEKYRTDATLFVGENRPLTAGVDAFQLDEVLAQSYAELLEAPDIEQKVADRLSFEATPGELDKQVDMSVIPGTRLVEIDATDEVPERAQEIANTYAETFVEDRVESATAAGNDQLRVLRRQIATLVTQINALDASTDPTAAVQEAQLQAELDAVRSSYGRTRENASLAGTNVSVSTTASLPTAPAVPRPKLYLAIGFILAFALAAGAALLRDAFDKRPRDEDVVADLLKAPILARVPASGRDPMGNPAFAESMQFLRANLPSARGRGMLVIAVTSAPSENGKTTIAAGLTTAIAEMGERVVAMDCDLRRPMLASRLGVESSRGLTDVLRGRRRVSDVLVPVVGGPIQVLSTGAQPESPTVILTEAALRGVLDQLRGHADVVVIDTPPVLAGAETAAIMRTAHGVLLVVDLARDRTDQLEAASHQLQTTGAKVVGVVVNRVSARRHLYSYYDYRREPSAPPPPETTEFEQLTPAEMDGTAEPESTAARHARSRRR